MTGVRCYASLLVRFSFFLSFSWWCGGWESAPLQAVPQPWFSLTPIRFQRLLFCSGLWPALCPPLSSMIVTSASRAGWGVGPVPWTHLWVEVWAGLRLSRLAEWTPRASVSQHCPWPGHHLETLACSISAWAPWHPRTSGQVPAQPCVASSAPGRPGGPEAASPVPYRPVEIEPVWAVSCGGSSVPPSCSAVILGWRVWVVGAASPCGCDRSTCWWTQLSPYRVGPGKPPPVCPAGEFLCPPSGQEGFPIPAGDGCYLQRSDPVDPLSTLRVTTTRAWCGVRFVAKSSVMFRIC